MLIEGIEYCDLCGTAIFPDDGTTVKIEKDGQLHQFHFHNRHGSDCLAMKLAELKKKFESTPTQTPTAPSR